MKYVNFIEVIQNDYGYDLEFKVLDARNIPVDLSSVNSIKVIIAEANSNVAKVIGFCSVVNPQEGICKYTVREGDFDEPNKVYKVELELEFTGKVITVRGASIKVLPELPETTS